MKVKDVEAMICHFAMHLPAHRSFSSYYSSSPLIAALAFCCALRLTSLMRVSQSTWDWLPRTCHQSKSVAAISPPMKHSKPSERRIWLCQKYLNYVIYCNNYQLPCHIQWWDLMIWQVQCLNFDDFTWWDMVRYPNSKAGMPATVAPTAASAVDPSGPDSCLPPGFKTSSIIKNVQLKNNHGKPWCSMISHY